MKFLEYAIADVHGHLDQFDEALDAIGAHALQSEVTPRLILVGDMIDRGPNSLGLIEQIRELRESGKWEVIELAGNHEVMLLEAFIHRDRSSVQFWLKHGGYEFVTSTGYQFSWVQHRDFWDRIPLWYINHLKQLPLYYLTKHRVYVHAGVMPGVPLREQAAESLLWIRNRFLNAAKVQFAELGVDYIVHGHTPTKIAAADDSIEMFDHRCNLDSGTFFTGVLNVGVFDPDIPGGPVEILRVEGPEPIKPSRKKYDPNLFCKKR